MTSITKKELIDFESEIASLFNAGKIPYPVHLSGGCEDQILEIAKGFKPGDYFFGTWRAHYLCLVAGVPASEVKAAILAGRSITLCFPQYRVLSSAIVAGCCPIALGVAWQLKRTGSDARAYCFIGDMAARTGLYHECSTYSQDQGLPVTWVIEKNGLSVCTNTEEAWGTAWKKLERPAEFETYTYRLPWPHSGAGQRVNF